MPRSAGARVLPLLLAATAFLFRCSDLGTEPDKSSGNGGGGGEDTLTTYTDVRGLLQAKGCLSPSCHGTATGQGGLDLRTYETTIAGGSQGGTVVPGDSGASSLYAKTTPTPPFGSRMPLTGSPLLIVQQKTIADWIDQGAKNN